jgi:hypothetical protein
MNPIDTVTFKDAALGAVGRTVINFQRLEHNLKIAARLWPHASVSDTYNQTRTAGRPEGYSRSAPIRRRVRALSAAASAGVTFRPTAILELALVQ